MIYEGNNEVEYYILECPKCFYRWEEAFKKGNFTSYSVLCEYCFNHIGMDDLELIKRRLAIFEYSVLSRTPVTLRHMFDFLMEKINLLEKK